MGKLFIVAIGLVVIAAAGWVVVERQRTVAPVATAASSSAPASTAAPTGIGCLGRIEPERRLVVTAPYYESRPSLVAELNVKEGSNVESGQLLAILDSRRLLESALSQADSRIAVARQKLNQVQAGAKPADVDALRAERARLQALLQSAEIEAARYRSLLPGGATSKSSVEEKTLAVTTLQHQIEQTDQKIRSLLEVRPSDVAVAEAELAAAIADRRHIEVQMESSTIKAPVAGRVLSIHAHPGEEVGPQGLLELAQIARMYIVAEVFEADLARVHVGSKASARLTQSTQALHGAVERIDQQVGSPSILPADPLAFTDSRVVKVFIRLAAGQGAESLIRSTVNVTIEP